MKVIHGHEPRRGVREFSRLPHMFADPGVWRMAARAYLRSEDALQIALRGIVYRDETGRASMPG